MDSPKHNKILITEEKGKMNISFLSFNTLRTGDADLRF